MKKYYLKLQKAHAFDWIIYCDNNPVGNILTGEEDIKTVSLSFNIHPSYWGNGYIKEALSNQSELVTQKLNLEGYSEYSDEGLPVITKGDFSMTYNAEVTAGIDVKKIDVTVNDDTKTVKIKLPKAEIYSVKVDPGTIQYHDEKIALFNSDGKEDSDKAEKMAEKDAMEQARKCGLLENADKNAEVLVKGLLEGDLQGYSIEFVK